ncbi:MAG: protein translocase subunit SecD [Spirochaetaceae bacterium]|nr:protein translocase subunit SecD [Spirochaetaceae bacterium]
MSKRYRFIIILLTVAVCAVFLAPTVRWYFFVPAQDKIIALGSREQIKNYASRKAAADLDSVIDAARNGADLPGGLDFLLKEAKKIKKLEKSPPPGKWDAGATLSVFADRSEVQGLIEDHYRNSIFKLKNLQKNAVQLGLDLSGGLSIVLQANLPAYEEKVGHPLSEDERNGAIAQALEVLNNRIDRFGLTEPVIRRQGVDQIYVEIPGTADPERINDIIMGKGSLTFRMVDDDALEAFDRYYQANPGATFDGQGNLVDQTIIPADCEVRGVYVKDRYGLDEFTGYTVIKKEVGLDGNHITDARAERDNLDGRPEVNFQLDDEGAIIFEKLTSANKGKRLATVLDDRVRSQAVIQSTIRESGRLTGFSADETENLAMILRSAALPVELEVANQQTIGASMGEDTIYRGLYALLGGLAAVMVFMLAFYKTAGFNAVIAQVFNIFIMFSILSAFNFTLTLPSIAGFILTIGMAVDANVIIFERIKEELLLKKTRRAAVESGFNKAFWAIMDANITTFIAAVFLSQLGSGPIQGFAVSLAIGVFSSVFTALFVSRLIFDFGTDILGSRKVSISWRIK